ncbi:hypothetical protein K458DRAFT_204857 [Lentithecium fluviatile CBS 122367]|uniref:Uncharacterized protein n=1 Tax=Lentithecium fluviatile CBS 122367 TaxID=1168545 RepID=A0A6G1J9Z6_9PLEO|nr:hypothetical protein K458DRAFT_204857 [Lentithecium fluviatile CBS 122367]
MASRIGEGAIASQILACLACSVPRSDPPLPSCCLPEGWLPEKPGTKAILQFTYSPIHPSCPERHPHAVAPWYIQYGLQRPNVPTSLSPSPSASPRHTAEMRVAPRTAHQPRPAAIA